MKTCKTCGHEIAEQIGKTIIVKDLNIEVEIEVHDKGKKLSDITIPKGWRLLTIQEVVYLENSKFAKQLKMDGSNSIDNFFYEQPLKQNKGKYVARFFANSYRTYLDCNGDSQYSDAYLGVRFCRKKVGK